MSSIRFLYPYLGLLLLHTRLALFIGNGTTDVCRSVGVKSQVFEFNHD